MLKYQTWVGS